MPIGGLGCHHGADRPPHWGPGQLGSRSSHPGRLWVRRGLGPPSHAAESIRSDMSGSPIVTEIGTAIGVVCTAAAPWEDGPNPRLTHNLPGWLLRDPSCPEPQ